MCKVARSLYRGEIKDKIEEDKETAVEGQLFFFGKNSFIDYFNCKSERFEIKCDIIVLYIVFQI